MRGLAPLDGISGEDIQISRDRIGGISSECELELATIDDARIITLVLVSIMLILLMLTQNCTNTARQQYLTVC